jgi:hypothetical protein
MAKRRARSQTVSLTPNQKKLGINLIYLAADDVIFNKKINGIHIKLQQACECEYFCSYLF